MDHLTICFVYQAGSLAVKARHLLRSIRKFSPTVNIYLGIPLPEEIYGKVDSAEIAQLITEFRIRILYFENSISHTYKIGNKIQLFYEVAKSTTGPLLFLDSDILQLAPLTISDEMMKSDLSMKLADSATYQYPPYLTSKYLMKPGTYLTTVGRQKMNFPYCNAGFIFCSPEGLKKGFPAEWLRVARELFLDPMVTNKFPWLDQIAIPIVIDSLKLDLHLVDEDYNYPYHLRKVMRPGVIFCHYHHIDNLPKIG